MRNPLSDKAVSIPWSGIRKFFDVVNEMPDAISLGVGEPDFDTPWHIRDEGIYTLEKGRTFYTSNAGLKELREENIVTPVLLLTAKAEVDDRVNGLDAGADDYLTKPFAMKELLARVRAMTRRKTEYAAKKLQYGDFSLDDEKFELSCENSVRLSVKEFELLQALILNQNHEVSTQYLLEHVWDGAEAGPDTVWLYISYLRGKLRSVASNVEIEGERGSSFRLTEAGR